MSGANKFSLNRNVDLSKFGWDGCSITLRSMTYAELKDFQVIDPSNPKAEDADRVVKFIQSKFVSGTAKDDQGETVQIKSEDIPNLPLEIYLHLQDRLIGAVPDPNS